MMNRRLKLADCDPAVVTMYRERVAEGAAFFNQHLPGWQERLLALGGFFSMENFDYCAAAAAGKGQRGPQGEFLHSHGSVVRAFAHLGFDPIRMGTLTDSNTPIEHLDILDILWREAAETIPPLPLAPKKECRVWIKNLLCLQFA